MSIEYKKIDFNKNWKFKLEDVENGASVTLDDSQWRQLNVPHDWSIEFAFDKENGQGCTAYLPGGIGWYRKHCVTPDGLEDGKVYLNFDGIYNHSLVYVNGELVSDRPNGYVPINIEISQYLKGEGQDNIIAVRVDHSRFVDSRWYPGSGIYRDVELILADKLHIAVDGTFVTTPEVRALGAKVVAEITMINDYEVAKSYTLRNEIVDRDGRVVAKSQEQYEIGGATTELVTLEFNVPSPKLWDTEAANMYVLNTVVVLEEIEIQNYMTNFGIRTIEFDVDKGFFLNGERTMIKGVCLHHDGGLVGSAVPRGVWERRLQILKEGGCNAIRTAHNPVSAEFLDLCDTMGFLVQDEFYDEWDYGKDKRNNMEDKHFDELSSGSAAFFQEWGEKDLKTVMLRDRNHPCVIQWSIGNEIEWTYHENKKITGYFDADAGGNYFWELPPNNAEKIRQNFVEIDKGDYQMGDTAKKLSGWVKDLDVSRPVTMNCILPSASYENGVADALDIIGYSYRKIMYDYGHNRMPNLPLMGAENLGQWHDWKAIIDREYVCGTFLWTGIDYLGESTGGWPQKALRSGLLDTAGFTKGSWHMMKTLWSEEGHIHIATNREEDSVYVLNDDGSYTDTSCDGGWEQRLWIWHDINNHWNYKEGEMVVVESYTNCKEVELFLDTDSGSTSYGVKALSDFEDHVIKWHVPFAKGTLRAVAKTDVDEELVYCLKSATSPVAITATCDKESLYADGKEVAHIVVQLVDEAGNPVRHMDKEVTVKTSGPCQLLGVDNGDSRKMDKYQAKTLMTSEGRCLIIVQSTDEEGTSSVELSAEGIKGQVVTFL